MRPTLLVPGLLLLGATWGPALRAADPAPAPLPAGTCDACRDCHAGHAPGIECWLEQVVELRGVRFRKGRPLRFHPTWNVAHGWLARDQDVHGHPARRHTLASFWPDGTPRRLTLARRHRVQGIYLVGEVSLHENGTLASGTLAHEVVLHGHRFPEGWRLRLSPTGRLLELPPCDDVKVLEDCG